jgi:predicted nucleic acid-binding Zn ribbon protein
MADPIRDEFLEFNPNPSSWYKYRCRSCSHTDWVEDIVVDAFPDAEPEGFPEIVCPECGGSFRCDTTELVKRSRQHPDHTT